MRDYRKFRPRVSPQVRIPGWMAAMLGIVIFLSLARATASVMPAAIIQPLEGEAGLIVRNSSGADKFTVSNAGNVTAAGTETRTDDLTLSGDGTDLLFNAANQNTIGAAAKGAKLVYSRGMTGENGQALALKAGSGANGGITLGDQAGTTVVSITTTTMTLTGDFTFDGDGTRSVGGATNRLKTVRLIPSASPPSTSSTPAGEFWITNGSPTCCQSANKLYVFINNAWTAMN